MTSGGRNPAGEGRGTETPSPAWIPCAICTDLIGLDQYQSARCWTDPHGITVAAHHHCLIALGETELDLPAA